MRLNALMEVKNCFYCNKQLHGRSDKKYCDNHCKSAFQYSNRLKKEALYIQIDRALKTNRKLLKKYNAKGRAVVRQSVLFGDGFNPKYYTHTWSSTSGNQYFFCYDYGFMPIQQKGVLKFLLIQWQEYMIPSSKSTQVT